MNLLEVCSCMQGLPRLYKTVSACRPTAIVDCHSVAEPMKCIISHSVTFRYVVYFIEIQSQKNKCHYVTFEQLFLLSFIF